MNLNITLQILMGIFYVCASCAFIITVINQVRLMRFEKKQRKEMQNIVMALDRLVDEGTVKDFESQKQIIN